MITESPINKTYRVLYGTSKAFKCAATGIPTPTLKWYKDDVLIENSTSVSVDTAMTLRLMDVRLEDSGVYKCVARNLDTSASTSANVTVYCKMFVF